MEYDGYTVGPNLRQLRTDRKLTLEQVSELTGLSTSSIKQLEQGGRNLSMKSLFLFMAAYECDANTLEPNHAYCVIALPTFMLCRYCIGRVFSLQSTHLKKGKTPWMSFKA